MEVVMMRRVLMTVGALLCVGLASAQAHENRQVGDYTLTCVEDPQTFPGKSPAGYRDNNAFSLN
jgi:hypothetical protein